MGVVELRCQENSAGRFGVRRTVPLASKMCQLDDNNTNFIKQEDASSLSWLALQSSRGYVKNRNNDPPRLARGENVIFAVCKIPLCLTLDQLLHVAFTDKPPLGELRLLCTRPKLASRIPIEAN